MAGTPEAKDAKADAKPKTELMPGAGAMASLQPQTLEQSMRLAEFVCKSNLVPKEMRNNPADVLIAINYGRELGFGFAQTFQSIMVVNGRPSVWGDAVLGKVYQSELLEDIQELDPTEALKKGYGECTVKRHGRKRSITRRFSMDDAKRANLLGKDTYRHYPGRMIQLRARALALRDEFPDILKGLAIREEMDDGGIITVQAEAVPMPQEKAPEPEKAKPEQPAEANVPKAEPEPEKQERKLPGQEQVVDAEVTVEEEEAGDAVYVGEVTRVTKIRGSNIRKVYGSQGAIFYTTHDGFATVASAAATQKKNVRIVYTEADDGKCTIKSINYA